jgi:chromosome segregation ATPase
MSRTKPAPTEAPSSAEPVVDSPSAAVEITQAVDAVGAQLTATQQELAEVLNANETLTKEVESLKAQIDEHLAAGGDLTAKVAERDATIADRDASMRVLASTNDELQAKVNSLEGQLEAAADAVLHRELPDNDTLHGRWIAAGGHASSFETAKRFAEQLLA